MKYQRTDKVQLADFSCLEELKCDIIENLLSLPKTDEAFEMIFVITDTSRAFELFYSLLESDVNGFNFNFIDNEELSLNELRKEDQLLITVSTDGQIWIERIYPTINLYAEFFYIDGDINSLWFRKVDDGINEILIFDAETTHTRDFSHELVVTYVK